MVIITNYKVKQIFNKFPEISRKIRINFQKFSAGNFQTHNPNDDAWHSIAARANMGCTVKHVHFASIKFSRFS